MKEFTIHSLEDIDRVAKEFLSSIGENKIFAFNGKMGAGKTTFIKAICKALNVQDNVCSPTFAIVNVYNSDEVGEIYHFDFYRLNEPSQALDIGTEEYFYSGNYCFLEWAENIGEFLPEDCIFVDITENTDKMRTVKLNL
ncbi:MAG: tRNA (adenosine(37)-N6)-threonylcarbamoyltransferase complex ATPase subunit type 1 TsaE [Bacteroidales bacterium]|nr:tRNA (adenosine(37)-N6)-threonylcarbamoyltransferase complex ATPase subunit type 1 TsaE [Bacteroidales bacterium]